MQIFICLYYFCLNKDSIINILLNEKFIFEVLYDIVLFLK